MRYLCYVGNDSPSYRERQGLATRRQPPVYASGVSRCLLSSDFPPAFARGVLGVLVADCVTVFMGACDFLFVYVREPAREPARERARDRQRRTHIYTQTETEKETERETESARV